MKKILITSGAHGEERSGPIVTMQMVRLLEKDPNHFKYLDIDFLPILNPTGYCLGTRENFEGKNLQNWFYDDPKKDEPLSVTLLRKFVENKKYDLLISLHEDPETDKFYLYGTNIDRNSIIIGSLFVLAKSHQFERYHGIDDEDLKLFVDDGFCAVDPNSSIETFEEWMSRTKRADCVITIEIGGQNFSERKIDLCWDVLYSILEDVNYL